MDKIKLPQVTLIALTGKDFEAHKKAVNLSCQKIEFGGVKIIWDEKCNTIDKWNKKVIYDLWKYVDTDYALFIHADGYVIHPELWNPDWLNYDYIGAPWPLPTDDYSYKDDKGNLQRVGNSVSLRSKKLMMLPTLLGFDWKPYYGNTHEDGFLCCHHRSELEESGMKFADINVAKFFSKEHTIEENKDIDKTFAFHAI